MNIDSYKALTFDCYGTLIDWESGVLAAIKPLLLNHNINCDDKEILRLFAHFEGEQEQGAYKKYREVLRNVVAQFGKQLGFSASLAEQDSLPDSIQNWQPFPDTIASLETLKQRFKLAIISNIDDDLFVATAKHLRVKFDQIITAEQAKSYKPSHYNFYLAIDRLDLPIEKILHIAGSLYHDIAPAQAIGLANVWVNRTGAESNLETTPAEVSDLKTIAELI